MRKCRPRSRPWPNASSNESSKVVRNIVVLLLATTGACESSIGDSPNLPEPGELNSGNFRYECLDSSDASLACSKPGYFPFALAVGGRFGLDFYPDESGQVLPQLASASSVRLAEHASGYFTMLASGYTAVLVLNGGSVVDFKHLRAANIDHLEVRQIGDTLKLNQIDLGLGGAIRLDASPHESYSDQALAGSLEYQWSSGDSSLLRISSDESSRQIEITGLNPGQTTITVTTGSVSLVLPVVIREIDDDAGESDSSTTGEDSGETGQVDTSSTGSEGSDTSPTNTSSTDSTTTGTGTDTDAETSTAMNTGTDIDTGDTTQGASTRGLL